MKQEREQILVAAGVPAYHWSMVISWLLSVLVGLGVCTYHFISEGLRRRDFGGGIVGSLVGYYAFKRKRRLGKIKFLSKYFQSITLNHAYRSTFNINNFTTNNRISDTSSTLTTLHCFRIPRDVSRRKMLCGWQNWAAQVGLS